MRENELTDYEMIAYGERMLNSSKSKNVEDHLLDCAECRKRFTEINLTTKNLKDLFWLDNEVSPRLDDAVFSDIERTLRKDKFRNLMRIGVAALLLITAASLVVFHTIPSMRQPTLQSKSLPVANDLIIPKVVKPKKDDVVTVRVAHRPSVSVERSGKTEENGTRQGGIKGDINSDGVVDIIDAQLLQARILSETASDLQADVTGDGAVDICDVQTIIKLVLQDSR